MAVKPMRSVRLAEAVPLSLVTDWLSAALPAALPAVVLAPAAYLAGVLRGGNLLVRGSNSNTTLSSSAFHDKKALKARRVRLLTNLSSKSVLPVLSSLAICSRSTTCCNTILPLLKLHEGVGWPSVGTAFSQT